MVGKRVVFDDDTGQALEAVARQTGRSFQELASTAFADFLKKHLGTGRGFSKFLPGALAD